MTDADRRTQELEHRITELEAEIKICDVQIESLHSMYYLIKKRAENVLINELT